MIICQAKRSMIAKPWIALLTGLWLFVGLFCAWFAAFSLVVILRAPLGSAMFWVGWLLLPVPALLTLEIYSSFVDEVVLTHGSRFELAERWLLSFGNFRIRLSIRAGREL